MRLAPRDLYSCLCLASLDCMFIISEERPKVNDSGENLPFSLISKITETHFINLAQAAAAKFGKIQAWPCFFLLSHATIGGVKRRRVHGVEEEPGGPAGHHRDHRPGGRGRAAGGHGGVRAPHRPRGHRPGQAGKGGEKLRLRPPGGAPLPRPLPGGAGLPPIRPVRGLLLPAHLLPRGAGAESPAGAGRPGAHRRLCQPAPAAHPGGGGPGRLPEQGPAPPGDG